MPGRTAIKQIAIAKIGPKYKKNGRFLFSLMWPVIICIPLAVRLKTVSIPTARVSLSENTDMIAGSIAGSIPANKSTRK